MTHKVVRGQREDPPPTVWTQDRAHISLGGKHLHPLSHLARP